MILRGNYCGLIVTTETPLKQIMLRLYPIAIRSRQHLSETWPSAVCRCRGVDYFLAIETPKEPHSTGNASHHQRLLLSGKKHQLQSDSDHSTDETTEHLSNFIVHVPTFPQRGLQLPRL